MGGRQSEIKTKVGTVTTRVLRVDRSELQFAPRNPPPQCKQYSKGHQGKHIFFRFDPFRRSHSEHLTRSNQAQRSEPLPFNFQDLNGMVGVQTREFCVPLLSPQCCTRAGAGDSFCLRWLQNHTCITLTDSPTRDPRKAEFNLYEAYRLYQKGKLHDVQAVMLPLDDPAAYKLARSIAAASKAGSEHCYLYFDLTIAEDNVHPSAFT